MTTFTQTIQAPSTLEWWQWGKVHGALNIVALCAMLYVGVAVPPVVVAVLLHFFVDYTAQSTQVAMYKSDRGIELVVHALANGLQGALAGMLISPEVALVGAVVCVATHYSIDYTRKFGVKSVVLSAALDQAAHMLVYIVLFA